MRFKFLAALGLTLALALAGPAASQDSEGVKVCRKSVFRFAVGAESIEKQAEAQYLQMARQAFQKRAIADDSDPQLQRLRKISRELLPGADKFNERAKDWKWEVILLGRSRSTPSACRAARSRFSPAFSTS